MTSIIERIMHKKLLAAFFIMVITAIPVFIIGSFHFSYMTNDDYMISLMINSGDDKCLYLSYFLTWILTRVHSIIGDINLFAYFELCLCLLSIIVVNYVFLCRHNCWIGIFLSIVIDIIVFSTCVLLVQYTQTTALVCSAGFLLLINSYQEDNKFNIFQRISSFLLIIVGSLFRIQSFAIASVMAFLLLLYYVFIIKKEKENHKLKQRKIIDIIKKASGLIITFVLIVVVGFGINFASEIIKNTDEQYVSNAELGLGRQMVTDYYVAPYEGNEEFYNKIGVDSKEDLQLISQGHIDKGYMKSDMLISIGDFSRKQQLKGDSKPIYALKKSVKSYSRILKETYKLVNEIRKSLSLSINNKLFFLAFCLLIILIIAIPIVLLIKKHKKVSARRCFCILLKVLLVLIWIVFFYTFKINEDNYLALLLAVVAVIAPLLPDRKYLFASYLFTLSAITIYSYQICFRLNYRSSFTFIFSALLFLMYCFDSFELRVKYTQNNMPVKILWCSAPILMIAAVIVHEILFAGTFIIPQTATYNNTLKEYYRNSSKQYVQVISVNSVIDNAYFNTLLNPKLEDNTILYGSWCIASEFYDNHLNQKGINNLFAELINNDNTELVLQLDDENVVDCYEVYFNNHYSKNNKIITLKEVDMLSCKADLLFGNTETKEIGVYKVVAG